MSLTVITPPTETVVDPADLRSQLRLDSTDQDADLTAWLTAATGLLEAATQRRFLTQVLAWTLPAWPAIRFRLPVAPVAPDGVASIAYVDTNGATQTLSASAYVVSRCGETVEIRPTSTTTWPSLSLDAVEPVKITFTAGEAAADVDPMIKQAARLLVAHFNRYRGDDDQPPPLSSSNLPSAVEALIAPWRWA